MRRRGMRGSAQALQLALLAFFVLWIGAAVLVVARSPGEPHAAITKFKRLRGDDASRTPFDGVELGIGHRFRADRPLDFDDVVSVGLWIKLAPSDSPAPRTILSNRASGCSADEGDGAAHAGFALVVNEWQPSMKQLSLLWSSHEHPCESVHSEPNSITPDVWTHVGFSLIALPLGVNATLFINGNVAATRLSPSPRRVSATRLVVGSHTDFELPFSGRGAHLAVYHSAVNPFHPFQAPVAPPHAAVGHWLSSPSLDDAGLERLLKPDRRTYAPFAYLVPPASEEELAAGLWPPDSSPASAQSDALARSRRGAVRVMMAHAYRAYESRAMGYDEVRPRTGWPQDNWGGMAMTMVDSLDTLWLLGLKAEFYRARDWIARYLNFAAVQGDVSVFETTIRSLGGLLAAYELSGERVFLSRAVELGDRLLPAFDTRSGVPASRVSLAQRSIHGGDALHTNIAEAGSLQLEFRALSRHTGVAKYALASERAHAALLADPPADGLYGTQISLRNGARAGGAITFGGAGDSFYEYLLKLWLQGGRAEPQFRRAYDAAVDGLVKRVAQRSSPSRLAYLATINANGQLEHRMEHLACFAPGMLALGSLSEPDAAKAKAHLELAKALMYTCWLFYARTPTRIGAEAVAFQEKVDFHVPHAKADYILRPEVAESLYILHFVTRAPIYRDWGWQIAQAIEARCRLPFGYGSLPDVLDTGRGPMDKMESFFLAETLKYLYLLQDPDAAVSPHSHTFNTEAHPLRIFPTNWRGGLRALWAAKAYVASWWAWPFATWPWSGKQSVEGAPPPSRTTAASASAAGRFRGVPRAHK